MESGKIHLTKTLEMTHQPTALISELSVSLCCSSASMVQKICVLNNALNVPHHSSDINRKTLFSFIHV